MDVTRERISRILKLREILMSVKNTICQRKLLQSFKNMFANSILRHQQFEYRINTHTQLQNGETKIEQAKNTITISKHFSSTAVLAGSPSRSSPSSSTPFYSVLLCVSVFMALSTVFHSINSPDNSPLSHSVLPVLFLPYWSFQLCISK